MGGKRNIYFVRKGRHNATVLKHPVESCCRTEENLDAFRKMTTFGELKVTDMFKIHLVIKRIQIEQWDQPFDHNLCVCVYVFLFWLCVCPRASFIHQPRGKSNLLPVLMVPPVVPVWIGFRGHKSQAIRSKWSLCNTRQTAKSFRTKPRPLSCVCVLYCRTPIPLFHSILATVTGLILVYFQASDLADDPFILTSLEDCKPLIFFILTK